MPRSSNNKSFVAHKPLPMPETYAQKPSLGQTVKEGFGLGIGISVAQHAVNGIMNFLMD